MIRGLRFIQPNSAPHISAGPSAYLHGHVEPVGTPGASPVHAEGSALSQGRASCTSGAGVLVTAGWDVFSTPCPRTEKIGEMLRPLAGPRLGSAFTHSGPAQAQPGGTHLLTHLPDREGRPGSRQGLCSFLTKRCPKIVFRRAPKALRPRGGAPGLQSDLWV